MAMRRSGGGTLTRKMRPAEAWPAWRTTAALASAGLEKLYIDDPPEIGLSVAQSARHQG